MHLQISKFLNLLLSGAFGQLLRHWLRLRLAQPME
jgi:hypothetical protein